MPLSLGLRDEENERINSAMQKVIALVFVPDNNWNEADVNQQLKTLGLDLNTLNSITATELIDYIVRYHFDWANMEQFADVLAKLSAKAGLEALKEKGVALYNYIQAESKMFSFDIMNKVNSLR
jgi:ubiquinone biosynthesis protein COQ9